MGRLFPHNQENSSNETVKEMSIILEITISRGYGLDKLDQIILLWPRSLPLTLMYCDIIGAE